MHETPTTWLLADVGGTKTRAALWRTSQSARDLRGIVEYRNAEFNSLDALLAKYLHECAPETPTRAGLAIAGPIRGSPIRLLNIDWGFETEALACELGLTAVDVINDFHAQAIALQVLEDQDRIPIGNGVSLPRKPLTVLGPGTGLGVAGLTPAPTGYSVVTGEGGHATLAPASDEEAAVIAEIRRRCGHCSAERVLSGSGLTLLHYVLNGERGIRASDVSRRAKDGDLSARRTFNMFFDFLGTVASDLTLTLGAMGGTYITGGISLANKELLLHSGFRQRFINKGRYRDYLDTIPTWLITAETPALYGLAIHARQLDAGY